MTTRKSLKRVAAQFQRLDGIDEGRRRGIGRDGGDLSLVLGEGTREGRAEVLGPYPLERRHAEAPGPVLEERVVAVERRVGGNGQDRAGGILERLQVASHVVA